MPHEGTRPSVLGVQVNAALLLRRILHGFTTFVLLRAKGVILLPILTRLLGPDGMGVLALAGATANLVWPLAVLGLHTGLAVQAVHTTSLEQVRKAHSSVILVATGTAIVGGAMITAFITLFGSRLGLERLHPYALTVGILVVVAGLKEVATTIPQVSQRTALISVLNLTVEFGRTVLAIVLVLGGLGPAGALWSDTIAYLIGFAWASYSTVRQLGFSFTIDWSIVRACLVVSLPLLPVSVGQWVLQALSSYFISYHHGDAAVGVYSVATTLASLVLAVNAVLNLIFFPSAGVLFQQGWDRFVGFTKQTLRLSSFVLGLACVGSALLAPWGVNLVAGSEYTGAVRVIPWVVAGYSAWTLMLVLQAVLMIIERRTERVAWIYFITTLLNVILNIFLIPRGQLVGAAAANVLSFAAGLFLMARVVFRVAPGLREWRSLILPWLPALLLMPLSLRFASQPNAPILDPFVRVSVLIGVYLVLGVVLGIVGRNDLQVLRTKGGT